MSQETPDSPTTAPKHTTARRQETVGWIWGGYLFCEVGELAKAYTILHNSLYINDLRIIYYFSTKTRWLFIILYIIPKGRADMNQTVKTELDKIVSTLAETGIVTKIILFGSYAKGEETPNSDIDLCVLTPVNDKRPIELMSGFRKKLRGVKTMPLDLFAFNQDEFYNYVDCQASFQHEIAMNGVLLYEHK